MIKNLKPGQLQQDIKAVTFLSWLAEIFDNSILANLKNTLNLTEQLHFWTGYVQSIVKATTEV